MHWCVNYLGKPWSRDGFGPDSYHCWGLVWHVSQKHFGVVLPRYGIDAKAALEVSRQMEKSAVSPDWLQIAEPVDGCIVAMSQNTRIHHVGIFLNVDGGMILHSREGGGVLCESLSKLKTLPGWNRIEFYTYGAHHRNFQSV